MSLFYVILITWGLASAVDRPAESLAVNSQFYAQRVSRANALESTSHQLSSQDHVTIIAQPVSSRGHKTDSASKQQIEPVIQRYVTGVVPSQEGQQLDNLKHYSELLRRFGNQINSSSTENGKMEISRKVAKNSENATSSPYEFSFMMSDGNGTGQHRQESSGLDGIITGSYGYLDPVGIYRLVKYTADHNGFRAMIRTNEPGVVDQQSPDVIVIADKSGTGDKERAASSRNSFKKS